MQVTFDGDGMEERALAYIKQYGSLPGVLTIAAGQPVQARIAESSSKCLMYIAKGRRRHGYRIPYQCIAITLKVPKDRQPRTAAQEYADHMRKYRDYFLKYSAPTMWADLRKQLEAITDPMLEAFAALDIASHYDAWSVAKDHGLLSIERHKTLSLGSTKAPAHILQAIAEAIPLSAPFEYWWRGSYDYNVSARVGPDKVYRGWLSAEFKGMGNGHYYLLISAERALFGEDD